MSGEGQIKENTPVQISEPGAVEEMGRTKVGDRRHVKVYNTSTGEEREITVTCVEVKQITREDGTELGEVCVWQ